jgi:amidase|tara:strand:+ start:1322 stop:2863 length:1542 start_codon:yes stop_codon:yes gene_type:complete
LSKVDNDHSPSISRRQLLKSTVLATVGFAATRASSQSETSIASKQATGEISMFQSAVSLAQEIRNKKLGSEELVRQHLQRIEQINPKINAVVALADDAIEQAKRADKALAKGNPAGPLHGVPMTIKDCFDTAGVVSTWGTWGRKDHVPDEDATVVKRLKAAGAILIGKTNTPEFTLSFETHNNIHGFTNNPYDLNRSPGGSSGGAAAAIASGMTPFDIGTDYGGSIRVPSHCCGTVGIKPTSGSVPRTGLCLPPGMLTDSLSHVGPLARRVEDLRMLLPIIWGPDTVDTRIASMPFPDPDSVELKGLKCMVMTDNGVVTPDKETIAAVEMAGKFLADAGLAVREDRLSGLADTTAVDGGFWGVGAYTAIKLLLDAAGTKPDQYANNWFRQMDQAATGEVSAESLNGQLSRFEQFRSRLLQQMSQYDVLISPVNARPAQIHPTPGGPPFPHAYAAYTIVFDLTGWPSGVVRGGISPEGLPIGVQITANPWREDIVLAVMSHLEQVFPTFAPPVV